MIIFSNTRLYNSFSQIKLLRSSQDWSSHLVLEPDPFHIQAQSPLPFGSPELQNDCETGKAAGLTSQQHWPTNNMAPIQKSSSLPESKQKYHEWTVMVNDSQFEEFWGLDQSIHSEPCRYQILLRLSVLCYRINFLCAHHIWLDITESAVTYFLVQLETICFQCLLGNKYTYSSI